MFRAKVNGNRYQLYGRKAYDLSVGLLCRKWGHERKSYQLPSDIAPQHCDGLTVSVT